MQAIPSTRRGFVLAPLIDHTLLKADATASQILAICREARQYGFASVCVNPCMVELARRELEGSSVKTCTVVGFPTGGATTATKAFEAANAIENGAQELDMVISLFALKERAFPVVLDDIKAVVGAASGHIVKVIIETCFLSDDEKATACRLAVEAGSSFVKTSTGMGGGGATAEDVRLMRRIVGPDFGVKASGGIRSLEDAIRMIDAGANRIGTSCAVEIATSVVPRPAVMA